MRLHQVIFALAIVGVMQLSAGAQQIFGSIDETGESPVRARPAETPKEIAVVEPSPERERELVSLTIISLPVTVPTPLLSEFQNEKHANTYRDVYRILKEDNLCSRFFGGPVQATEVLNRLAERLKPARMGDNRIAIKMRGAYMQIQNQRTGASYRLFEQVMVNSEGPFSRAPMVNTAQPQSIGHFPLHTRAARALILLHELGHLVQGADGHWLLPNDGHNSQLSLQNTSTVESHCRKQLTALKAINE
jgi:hypothetical protein